MNSVYVEYDGGINTALEEDINKAASYNFDESVKCDSGSCLFAPFTRDLAFYYDSTEKAAGAAEKLRGLSGVRVRTELAN